MGTVALIALLCFLFVAGFSLRLYLLNEPLLYFNAVRQYRGAIIARSCYLEHDHSVAPTTRKIAALNRQREGRLEPQILEDLACAGYRISGGEQLWIPHLFSALFWLLGGVFLFLIARRLCSREAALFGLAFYLLLPYSIPASKSFQPDPLMVMMELFGLLALVRYDEAPSRLRLLAAGLLSGAAILIKPVSIFIIAGAFIALNISRHGVRKGILSSATAVFAGVAFILPLAYYFYGLFIAGFLEGQAGQSFIPALLGKGYYWYGWLIMVNRVITWPLLIAALFGWFVAGRGMPRALLTGLWIGYLVFGLVFNNHIHTHDYYQLQLIPIAALGLGVAADYVLARIRTSIPRPTFAAVVLIALVSIVTYYDLIKTRFEHARLGDLVAEYQTTAREIGETIDHSPNTIMLDHAFGKPLEYHGGIAGTVWPGSFDLQRSGEWGKPVLSPRQMFAEINKGSVPEYFVVTALEDFDRQPDLKQFLYASFPVLKKTDRYIIFDLRKSASH